MPKKQISSCAEDAIFAGIKQLPADAQILAIDYLKVSLGDYLSKEGKELVGRTEALGIGAETVAKRVAAYNLKGEKFVTTGDATAAAIPESVMYDRAVDLDLINQHVLAPAYARISGATRLKYSRTVKTAKEGGALGRTATSDAISRWSASEAAIRSSGIPIVTSKAASQAGPNHYAFLGAGDSGRVILAVDEVEGLRDALFRSGKGEQNIQTQNFTEAVRRIIERADNETLEAITPEELYNDIFDAITKPVGKPSAAKDLALHNKHLKWVNSAEGQKVATDFTNLLTTPKVIDALVAENTRIAAVTMALAKADGFKMAAQALESVSQTIANAERLRGYGKLLLDGGIKKIFGKDKLAKLTPDQLNLAFADNAFALFFNNISDESLAVIKDIARTEKGMAKDAAKKAKTGKQTRGGRNAAKAEQVDEIGKIAEKQVADEIVNDPNVRAGDSSIIGASLNRQYYLEMHYGSVVGGLAKAIAKVSDRATMGNKLKTMLIGTEHVRLENAATVTSELRKMADNYGQDIPRFNRVFRATQKLDLSKGVDAAIRTLAPADQALAKDLLYFTDKIFNLGEFNKMMQEGIYVDEMAASLKSVGLFKQAEALAPFTDPADVANYWRNLEIDDTENIVEIMSKTYAATQLSLIKPALAASAIRHFGHKADGLTYAEAIKQGYKPITGEGGLSDFLSIGDQPALFHPEIVGRLQSLNGYLNYERGFKSPIVQKAMNVIDPTVSVLKSSLTIWRPGHHATSIMGNTFFNALAGVSHVDYAYGMKMLFHKGDIDDLNEEALKDILKNNVPEGYVFKGDIDNGVGIPLIGKDGKAYTQMIDYNGLVKGAAGVAGVTINARRVKDVVDNELLQGTTRGALMNNPVSKGIANTDHAIARMSAYRDNIARYALFVKELRKGGPYKSVEDAFLAAGSKVHEFHPTVGTLTASERKIARRFFYFYTWQKQAFFKIMEMAANQPALITIPSKLQYAIAESQGLNPASFGDPYNPEEMFAGYMSQSVYGPQFKTEFGAMGVKPSAPQLDVIESYLSAFQTKPENTLWENVGSFVTSGVTNIVGKNINPLLKIPAELATGNKIGDLGKAELTPEYLIDQTGLSSVSRATGMTPFGQRSDYKPGEYEDANRERQIWNYWLGLKFTYYQSPKSLDFARQEQLDYWRKVNKIGQYAPPTTTP
jgi:hypothetical protein